MVSDFFDREDLVLLQLQEQAERIFEDYLRSDKQQSDLEQLFENQNRILQNSPDYQKRLSELLIDRMIAQILYPIENNQWKIFARESVQLLQTYHTNVNPRRLRKLQTKRIRKIRRDIERATEDQELRYKDSGKEEILSSINRLKKCAEYVKKNENKFVNKREPVWD